MVLQDKLISINEYRPFHSVFLNKIIGNSSRIIARLLVTIILPWYFRKHSGIQLYRKAQKERRVSEAVVSLTTFPARVGVVWMVIECMLRQTRVPNKIVVWLSRDQFRNIDDIPASLKAYPQDVVEIRMVDGDIRSHKKYWYSVREFPNSPIVLVDDDIIYDSHLIEDLENISQKYDNVITCCWGAKMEWDVEGNVLPYSRWSGKSIINMVSNDFFYGSGGGTYFPIGSLKGANMPVNIIMEVCPLADDIWLNAITRFNHYKTCLIRNYKSMLGVNIKGNSSLSSVNNGQQMNDIQLENVKKFFICNYKTNPFIK